jgi:hypothetical protein|tara:strand:- start:710 stop:1627 length:918 start_codon:yes stop_codon:yes gene_type:complete
VGYWVDLDRIMIPGNILKQHILIALDIIDKNGMPKNRASKKFDLLYKNKKYPPKYAISIANKVVNNIELDPEIYSGGNESNNLLIRLGFEIIDKSGKTIYNKNNYPNKYLQINRQNKHTSNTRCTECKNSIYEMLRSIYGTIKIEHKFHISTKLDDYKNLYVFPYLEKIYLSLVKYRGYDDFVKAKTLSNCDMYVVEKDFIAEIDEMQHFSRARLISLMHYPTRLKLNYNIDYWKKLCKKYKVADNNPIYRDEQRAWYDTLRDFLPLIDNSFQPTLRIFSGDYGWCSLNHKSKNDIEYFKSRLGL